jgi:hypothetical protein
MWLQFRFSSSYTVPVRPYSDLGRNISLRLMHDGSYILVDAPPFSRPG